MSAGIDQFTESLRTKLNKMETQLDGIKSDIQIGQKEDKAVIQAKLKKAKQGVQTMKKDIKAAETKAQNWLKAKEKAGSSVVRGWVVRFDKNMLDRHAKSAEQNAVAAISIAEGKIADAVLAMYEAIDARMAADEKPPTKH